MTPVLRTTCLGPSPAPRVTSGRSPVPEHVLSIFREACCKGRINLHWHRPTTFSIFAFCFLKCFSMVILHTVKRTCIPRLRITPFHLLNCSWSLEEPPKRWFLIAKMSQNLSVCVIRLYLPIKRWRNVIPLIAGTRYVFLGVECCFINSNYLKALYVLPEFAFRYNEKHEKFRKTISAKICCFHSLSL